MQTSELPHTVESKDSPLLEGKIQVEDGQIPERASVELGAKEPNIMTDADNPKQEEVHPLLDAEQSPDFYLPTTTSHGIEFSYPSPAKLYCTVIVVT